MFRITRGGNGVSGFASGVSELGFMHINPEAVLAPNSKLRKVN